MNNYSITSANCVSQNYGQTFADIRYGTNSSSDFAQGIGYANNNPVFGLSSHLNLLEDFNPNLLSDNTRWIPYGLYNDMNDPRDENVPVIDRVHNYQNQQFFNAIDNTITNMQQFRTLLLQQNLGNQNIEIENLFQRYNL
jgi:hypothetical protein